MEDIKIKVATEEAFDEAVKKAAEEFDTTGKNKDNDKENAMAHFMMGLQNMIFAALIKKHLFPDPEESKN